ncbi:MAG: SH3 domain-containing protein [Desulfatiglandaceae bacterium]
MPRKYVLWVTVLVFATVGSVSYRARADEGYASWEGRVTARVNVRKAPGKDSEIITQINSGDSVTVNDMKKGWCKVVVEGDSFGFIGWVYGKYVTRAGGAEAQISTTAGPFSGTIVAKEQTSASKPKVSPAQDSPASQVPEKTISEDKAPLPNKSKARDSGPQGVEVGDISPKRQLPEAGKKARITGEKDAEGKRTPPYELSRAKSPERAKEVDMSTPKPSPAESVSPAGSLQKEDPAPGKQSGLGAQNNAPGMDVKKKKALHDAPETVAAHTQSDQGYRMVTGVVIKLMVVAFSCLAILLAHRALVTAGTRRG